MTCPDDTINFVPYDRCPDDEIGITKREYFAAMILQGLCSKTVQTDSEKLIFHSVRMADALIKELNK
jgi:hypothetical protein